jgi:hypothetical protein
MATAAAIVGAQIIAADRRPALLCNENFMLRGAPVRERVVARHVSRQRICFAGADRGLDHPPDRVAVAAIGCANPQGLSSVTARVVAHRPC